MGTQQARILRARVKIITIFATHGQRPSVGLGLVLKFTTSQIGIPENNLSSLLDENNIASTSTIKESDGK